MMEDDLRKIAAGELAAEWDAPVAESIKPRLVYASVREIPHQ
jgi:hypothetical protein